jgi:hypothetical protein
MPTAGPQRPSACGERLGLSVLLDADRYGRAERIRDMAQRVVHALAADASRIDLPLPLSVRREQDLLVSDPAEELIILRTIVRTLAGASFKGKVPIAEGVEAFLFDRGGQGVLAVWDRGGAAARAAGGGGEPRGRPGHDRPVG